jgi:hypothetical protein
MRRVARLNIGGARNLGTRIDQLDRIEQRSAIVALIAARAFKTAIRACAFDVAVRQEALVVDRIDLLRDALFNQAVLLQDFTEVLGELVVRRVGRSGPK